MVTTIHISYPVKSAMQSCLKLVLLVGLQNCLSDAEEVIQVRLVQTLGIPLAPTFHLKIYLENLQYPLVITYRCIFPKKDDGADFGCIWIQFNGAIAHAETRTRVVSNQYQEPTNK